MLAQQRAGRRKNDLICSGLPEGTSDFTYTNHSIKYGPVRLYEIGFAYHIMLIRSETIRSTPESGKPIGIVNLSVPSEIQF